MDNTFGYNQVEIHEILFQSSVLFSILHHLHPDIDIDWILPGSLGTTYGLPLPLLKLRLSQSAPVFVLKAFPHFSDGCKMHKEELGGFCLKWEEDSELAIDKPLCRHALGEVFKKNPTNSNTVLNSTTIRENT